MKLTLISLLNHRWKRRRINQLGRDAKFLRKWVGIEQLESRQLLAANALATQDVAIPSGNHSREFNLSVSLPNAASNSVASVGVMWSTEQANSVASIPNILGENGLPIRSSNSVANSLGHSGLSLIDLFPGRYTVAVDASNFEDSDSMFQLEVFVPGDILSIDGMVDRQEFLTAAAVAIEEIGAGNHVSSEFFELHGASPRDVAESDQFDINKDGQIDEADLALVQQNSHLGQIVVQLAGDQIAPEMTVHLQNDTGTSSTDRITEDPTLSGSVIEDASIVSFRASVDGSPRVELDDLLAGLNETGQFEITSATLESVLGVPLSEGPHSIMLEATDDAGNTAAPVEISFNLIVDNSPPTIDSIPDAAVDEEQLLTIDTSSRISDPNVGDVLSFSAALEDGGSLPAWIRFDSQTGQLSGTPSNDDVGTLTIALSATDSQGSMVTDLFDVVVSNVNDAPTASLIPDQSIDEDATLSFSVESFFNDVDPGDSLSFEASLSDGGNLPDWLAFDPQQATFSGAPTDANLGTLALRVTATDQQSASALAEFNLTVVNVNDAPVQIGDLEDQQAEEDLPFEFNVSPFFEDSDPDEVLTFTATQADGTALPDWLAIDTESGVLSGTPSNDDTIDLVVQVTVTDSASIMVTDTFGLFVVNTNDPPMVSEIPDQQVDEDSPLNLDAGQFFTDIDPGDNLVFFGSLDGGGELPDWLSFNDATGLFTGTPSNDDTGTLSIAVGAQDGGGAETIGSFDLLVNNVNDAPVIETPISNQAVDEDSSFSLNLSTFFTDIDPDDSLTFSAVGDGGSLPNWMSVDSATGLITGVPTNDDVGSISITATASDNAGAETSQTFEVQINNVNDDPVITDQFFAVLPGSAAGTEVGVIVASDIDAEDALAFEIIDGDPNGAFELDTDTGTLTVADASQMMEDVQFDLAVRVVDTGPSSATATITVLVTPNLPPTAMEIPDQNATEDSSFTFDISGFFRDPEGDSLTYSATQSDGSQLPGWLAINEVTGNLLGVPTNADVGTTSLEVRATDAHGDSATASFDLTVDNTNDAPTVTASIPVQMAEEDTLFNFNTSNFFEDPDVGDSLTYSAELASAFPLPAWLTIAANTGNLNGTPRNDDVGALLVAVTATDGLGERVSQNVEITIVNTNDIPDAVADTDFGTSEDEPLSIDSASLLANDSDPDLDDTLQVINVSPTSQLGASVILDGDQIIYDPTEATELLSLHQGREQLDTFQYSIQDAAGLTDTANVTVRVTGKDLVRFRLETTNLSGQVVSQVAPGESFNLRVFVEDLRGIDGGGVFSPYLDVTYDSQLASVAGDTVFGPDYSLVQNSNTSTAGVIDEVGAVGPLTATGPGEFLLFTIEMAAGDQAGSIVFQGNEPDDLPAHELVLYSMSEAIPPFQVDYGETTLDVVSPQAALSESFSALTANTLSTTATPTDAAPISSSTSDDSHVDVVMSELTSIERQPGPLATHILVKSDFESILTDIALDITGQWDQALQVA